MERYEGYAVDLIQKLANIMNFEYEFLIESRTGKKNPETGEWDGMIRRLIDHVMSALVIQLLSAINVFFFFDFQQAQIAISDITITQARRQVVDFTVPFMQLGISILYYKRAPEAKNEFAFLEPFAEEVWYYLMLTQLIMTLLFVILAR